jgi:hypothetical protein
LRRTRNARIAAIYRLEQLFAVSFVPRTFASSSGEITLTSELDQSFFAVLR